MLARIAVFTENGMDVVRGQPFSRVSSVGAYAHQPEAVGPQDFGFWINPGHAIHNLLSYLLVSV